MRNGSKLSKRLIITSGVRQSGVLVPLLFSVALNWILNDLAQSVDVTVGPHIFTDLATPTMLLSSCLTRHRPAKLYRTCALLQHPSKCPGQKRYRISAGWCAQGEVRETGGTGTRLDCMTGLYTPSSGDSNLVVGERVPGQSTLGDSDMEFAGTVWHCLRRKEFEWSL